MIHGGMHKGTISKQPRYCNRDSWRMLISIPNNGGLIGPRFKVLCKGAFPPARSLLTLTGYTAVFGFLAVRFFRWDSRMTRYAASIDDVSLSELMDSVTR